MARATKKKKEETKTMKSIVVNDCVFIQNGAIASNPFLHRLEYSKVAQWMINNRDIVMRKIHYLFKDFYISSYGGNVEDCFGYALWYFTNSKKKAFHKGYFGSDTNYDVKNYCLAGLTFAVRAYGKELQKLETQALVSSEDAEKYRGVVVEETVTDTSGYQSVEEEIYAHEFDRFDEEFSWLEDYFYYFEEKRYRNLDMWGYVTYMYFDVRSQNIEEHVSYVAEKIGASVDLVALVTDEFRLDVANEHEVAIDLLSAITDLVGYMKSGWMPKPLREERKRERARQRVETN